MKKHTIICSLLSVIIIVLVIVCANQNNEIKSLKDTNAVANTADTDGGNNANGEELAKKVEENEKLLAQINLLNTEVTEKDEANKLLQVRVAEFEKQIKNSTKVGNKTEYIVVYTDDSGIVHKEMVAKNGSVKDIPVPTARTGYDVKWSNDGQNITDDTVITAEYEAKTYNITYILGRPLDSYYSLCGANQYNEDNEVELIGITYVLNFDTNTVTSVYNPMLENSVENYQIIDNQFTISDTTYTINREFKVVYAVIGDNDVIAKPSFTGLPKTIRYGETISMGYFSDNYIRSVNRDGTASDGSDFGRRYPVTWVIYGADSITYDTTSVEADTNMYIRATGDLLIFVEYQREPI